MEAYLLRMQSENMIMIGGTPPLELTVQHYIVSVSSARRPVALR
jgi:hypothetical protein|eukprot:COSAG01_NODE_4185_length_5261_cov_2.430260_4_plen_44_part_00